MKFSDNRTGLLFYLRFFFYWVWCTVKRSSRTKETINEEDKKTLSIPIGHFVKWAGDTFDDTTCAVGITDI